MISARLSSQVRPVLRCSTAWRWRWRGLSSSSASSELSARDRPFFQQGYLDDRGLTRFETLHELQVHSCAVFKDNPLYGTYNATTESFDFGTYGDFDRQVQTTRRVLQHLGVSQYDKIALIANNRWEWAALATAAFSLRASVVPMYEAQLPADWSYIVGDAAPRVLFCATPAIYDRVVTEVRPNAPSSLQSILCLDAPVGEPHAFQTLFESNNKTTLLPASFLPLPTIWPVSSIRPERPANPRASH